MINIRMAAAIFVLFFCASVHAQEVEVIKVDVALVTVNVNVSDGKGRPLSSLKAEDFQVTDEGQSVTLGFFECQGPASIVLVVTTTGGLVHFPSSEGIGEVLRKINADMSSQYSLGYYPPDKTPGRRRRIQVNLAQGTRPLKLRYQQSYLIR
jgi:hypothetical protein